MNKHFKERARQRYNTNLDDKDIKQIINRIKNEDYLYAGRSENDPTKFFGYVKHKNLPFKVLFKNGLTPKLITIYPIDVDEYNNLNENHKIKKAINYLIGKGYIISKDRKFYRRKYE